MLQCLGKMQQAKVFCLGPFTRSLALLQCQETLRVTGLLRCVAQHHDLQWQNHTTFGSLNRCLEV